jgi:hypothetical protein
MLRTGSGSRLRRSTVSESTGAAVSDRTATRWVIACIVVFSCLQLLFLTVACDWDLCGDEAECWAWSRRLDWSYYARGPLIALIIRLGTALAGPASQALTGSLAAAVRLPALVFSGWTAWGLYRLGSETCRSTRVGLLAVLLLPAIPLFRVGGLIMTVDTPLVCFWVWAAVWSYRAIRDDRLGPWMIAGLLTALGVADKYTMLAFPASVGLYLVLERSRRRQLLRPGFWMLALGSAAGMAPILSWNARNGWAAAGQMSGRLGLESSWNWGHVQPVLTFLGGELAVIGLWWVIGVPALGAAVARAIGRGRHDAPQTVGGRSVTRHLAHDGIDASYLLCLWVVVWSACIAVSLLGETEANWSAPAHVALVVLMGWWLAPRVFGAGGLRRAAWLVAVYWVGCLIGLSALQHTEWFYPWVARFVPGPSLAHPAPFRRLDPTNRMRGYRELAPEVARRLAELQAEGADPFVLTPTYSLTATLSFYLPDQPEAQCLSWSPGLAAVAVNQHDLWHPNPRHDVAAFRDRPAVVVEDANHPPSYARGLVDLGVFDALGESSRVEVRRSGVLVGAWDITICRGYRGPQDVEAIRALFKTYASPAYYAAQGGTPRGFVHGLYRDLLGRLPVNNEEALWVHLTTSSPREMVVLQIALGNKDHVVRK